MYRAFFVDDEWLVLQHFMDSPVFMGCGFINDGHSINPFEAVAKVKETNPDVVFTDLKMPGLNGVELMETLKREGYDGEFVIISAYSEFEESRRFFKMGGYDYLIKPVSEEELQTLLIALSEKLAYKKGGVLSPKTPSDELNRILAYLYANLGLKHTLKSVGEKYDVKPNYLSNLFTRHLNTTFVACLQHIRMETAASLLRTTQLSIRSISTCCGYC
jgi:two-component system response regulator YesN